MMYVGLASTIASHLNRFFGPLVWSDPYQASQRDGVTGCYTGHARFGERRHG